MRNDSHFDRHIISRASKIHTKMKIFVLILSTLFSILILVKYLFYSAQSYPKIKNPKPIRPIFVPEPCIYEENGFSGMFVSYTFFYE